MWDLLLYCTAGSSLIVSICLVRAIYKEYKAQQIEIAQYKEMVKELQAELKAVNKKNEALMWACGNKAAKEQIIQKHRQMQRQAQEPAFLQADDPMDALLREVGKVKK